jgi:hypothetical protein
MGVIGTAISHGMMVLDASKLPRDSLFPRGVIDFHICRYEDRFDGVLLAHEATVESEQGKILNGLVPYFGVPVHANLLLYSPKPDMMLGRLCYYRSP